MTEAFQENRRETTVESEAKKLGRLLKLTFISSSEPELERIEFKYNRESETARLERKAVDKQSGFSWTAVPQAFSLLMLDYVCWRSCTEPSLFVFPQTDEARLAASIGDDRYKPTGLAKRLFVEKRKGCDREHVSKALTVRIQRGSTRPQRIDINQSFLPRDCIEVYLLPGDKPMTRSAILGLAKRIRKALGLLADEQKRDPEGSCEQPGSIEKHKYANAIRSRYGQVPLEVLDSAGEVYHELELLRIFVPQRVRKCQQFFPRALEAPQQVVRRIEIENASKSSNVESGALRAMYQYAKQAPQSVLDVVDGHENPRIVVLGALGGGKSTLLQFLALRWSEVESHKPGYEPLPLIIELRSYARARLDSGDVRDFLDFLDHGIGVFWRWPQEHLKRLLVTGGAVLYLDGLDEILDPVLREEVVTTISRFASEYPQMRMVVTSRLFGYAGDALRRAGFQHFMIEDFDDNQIMLLIDRWTAEMKSQRGAVQVDNKVQALKRAIGESSSLHELAANPLLLTIMLMLSRQEDLPTNRIDLLTRCSDLLLHRWKVDEALRADPDLASDATALGLSEKRVILRHLARNMPGEAVFHARGARERFLELRDSGFLENIISLSSLETIVAQSIKGLVRSNPLTSTRALVRQLRERNGILCFLGADQYSFVHRAFLEFFCADDLREEFMTGRIGLDDLKHYFEFNWGDESRHEVLVLLSAMLEPTFVVRLLKHVRKHYEKEEWVFEAAECLKAVKQWENVACLFVRLKKDLFTVSKRGPPKIECLPPFGTGTPPWVIAAAEDDLSAQQQALDFRTEADATRAVTVLTSMFGGDKGVAKHFRVLAESSKYDSVQSAAVKALADGWREYRETREWLENRAFESKIGEVRGTALEQLTLYWGQHACTRELLKARASLDRDSDVRKTAIRVIASCWKEDATTLPWLKRQVVTSKKPDIRVPAIEGIARNFHRNKSVLSWLREIASVHRDDNIRETAIREIGMNWTLGRPLLTWFKALARRDRSHDVRAAAVFVLRKRGPTNEDFAALFRALAQEDRDGDVRKQALIGLVTSRPDDANVFALLKSLSQTDQDPSVRSVAMELLFKTWRTHPDTFRCLFERMDDESWFVAMTAGQLLDEGWPKDPRIEERRRKGYKLMPLPPLPRLVLRRPPTSTRSRNPNGQRPHGKRM